MRYKNNSSGIFCQRLFYRLLRRKVKVVRRFIKNQYISMLLHHYGKTQLGTLSSADNTGFLKNILANQTNLRKKTPNFKIRKRRISAVQFLHNGQSFIQVGALLLEIRYFNIAVPAHNSLMRDHLLYNFKKRRLSDSIIAYNTNFISPADIKAYLVYQSFSGISFAHRNICSLDFQNVKGRLYRIRKPNFS